MIRDVLIICPTSASDPKVRLATSLFAHLEEFSLNFSSSLFVIFFNLLHPCSFMVYYYLFGVFLS